MSRRARIDRAAIVQAALSIIDTEGLAGLSMRTLATRLDVKAASLYNHVTGKRALQQLIADEVSTHVISALTPGLGWRDLLDQFAGEIRSELRTHPGAAQVLAVTDVSAEVYSPVIPIIVHAFAGHGVDDLEVLLTFSSLGVLVIGLAAAEFGDVPEPAVAPREYYDRWFALAVGTFLDGVAVRLTSGE
ncbi:MAG: TetR family transcriptional regulator [Actinobacteria bacterium]|nr:TetR family transcriptional regulator [Actinomycetota bacterium]